MSTTIVWFFKALLLPIIFITPSLSIEDNFFVINRPSHSHRSFRSVSDIEHSRELNFEKNDSIVTLFNNDEINDVSVVHLNDQHEQLTVHWAGKNSPVVICLAKNRLYSKNRSSAVYLSNDYGQTYHRIKNFRQKNGFDAIIETFYISPILNSFYIFVDKINRLLFITTDYGRNFQKIELNFSPNSLKLHPIVSERILMQASPTASNHGAALYLSENYGMFWRKLQDNIGYYSWCDDGRKILVQRIEPNGYSSLILLIPSLNSSLQTHSITDEPLLIKKVEMNGKYIFASVCNQSSSVAANLCDSVHLWISNNFHPLKPIRRFTNESLINFLVADVSENIVLLCVTKRNNQTDLYKSNDFRNFHLSTENIVFFNYNLSKNLPGVNRQTMKDLEFADISHVAEIRGTYIVSKWRNNERKSISDMITMITFDYGNHWHLLRAPGQDALGRLIDCRFENNCSLHLSQRFLSINSNSKPILSGKSSVGFIMATGILGNSMKGKQNIYLSVDSGNTWRQVLSGNYLYAFGDFGAIIVAIEHHSKGRSTNELYYSIDDGKSFALFKFAREKILVFGLLNEPGEKNAIFTIFGSKELQHDWIVIQVNLTSRFERQCRSPDDYVEWSPHDYESNCLLGSTEIFKRRISSSKCYNGINFERPVSKINCPCKHTDYECDDGYVRASKTMGLRCVANDLQIIQENANRSMLSYCSHFESFKKSQGYRKLIGNTCEGGEEKFYSKKSIPCPLKFESDFLLMISSKEIAVYDPNVIDRSSYRYRLLKSSYISSRPISADYELEHNSLIWIDDDSRQILRYTFDGGDFKPEIIMKSIDDDYFGFDEDFENPIETIALNQINNHLYFIRKNRSKIELIDINKNNEYRFRRTIMTKPIIDEPNGLAIDPIACFLFVSDSGNSPLILRSELDGQNVQILFNSNIIQKPIGLSIDPRYKLIFWADSSLNYIASSMYDGKNLKYHGKDRKISPSFVFVAYNEQILYYDWKHNRIAEMKLIYADFLGKTNVCNLNTTCSHLCIAKPFNSYRCLCPVGYRIDLMPDGNEKCSCNGTASNDYDECKNSSSYSNRSSKKKSKCSDEHCHPIECDQGEKMCSENSEIEALDEHHQCGPRQFRCRSSGLCIQDFYICDHEMECDDGSDEDYQLCQSFFPKCNETDQFQCRNYRCIYRKKVCDFVDDCLDGSDEINCLYNSTTKNNTCQSNEFRCDNDDCIPKSQRCDGKPHCLDKSDEFDCNDPTKCSENEFSCSDNICLDNIFVCDHEDDCLDGLDEKNCNYTDLILNPSSIENSTISCSDRMFQCESKFCIPQEWVCDESDDCPDFSDERYCSGMKSSDNSTCGYRKFFCSRSEECIPIQYRCDGDQDCRWNEDETNCESDEFFQYNCTDDQFECLGNSLCIEIDLVCNGKIDCPDYSDEQGCLNSKIETSSICLGKFI
ncbi:low-density liporeceptor-related 2-like protein 1 [Sarcoptes scabiei]|uniref:Low-density liporeceptor-related 2-like protein 1 n=1 Tax=Sarcoptes scabiei TaxID=52283 RepID=A0A131ZZ90_SARSC|nr:low-density liporeceptor-related 2-like protein 1 [Sarcoptes scabiei]